MANPAEALTQFRTWLPSELTYSARKAGYDKKIARAALPTDAPGSIYEFIGTEWHTHQLLKAQGEHYKPFHGKSAQLQIVKLAAGFFDKVALGRWLDDNSAATEDSFVAAAQNTAAYINNLCPWDMVQLNPDLEDAAFEDTPFASGVVDIMAGITRAVRESGIAKSETIARFTARATILGGQAVKYYQHYAEAHLTDEQLTMPVSELA